MISVIFALCALSAVDAYVCPTNASPTYEPPEYFGDCECDTGFKKATLVCEPLADSSEEASKTGECTGAGAWAGSTSMAAWCTANCNWSPPYCPAANCACATRRLEGVEKPLLEEDSPQAKPTGRRLTGSPYQTIYCLGENKCKEQTKTCTSSPCLIVCDGRHACEGTKIHGPGIADVLVTCAGHHACQKIKMNHGSHDTADWHISCNPGDEVCHEQTSAMLGATSKCTSGCPMSTEGMSRTFENRFDPTCFRLCSADIGCRLAIIHHIP
jgi:hypothetical protein